MLEIFYISYQTPTNVLLKLFCIWKCFTAKQMGYKYTCSTIRKFTLWKGRPNDFFCWRNELNFSHYIILIFLFFFWWTTISFLSKESVGCQILFLFLFFEKMVVKSIHYRMRGNCPYMLVILFYHFYVIFKLVPKTIFKEDKKK